MPAALPANLPDVANARLPATYEAAKTALANCAQIDECQGWADKMAALASYARQVEDDELRKMADRIKARAIRRCGELLRQIAPAKNQHDSSARAGAAYVGAVTSSSRTAAAKKAGLSERQKVTALRVANVPAEEFERQVESDAPPTVTKLAEQGKQPRPLVDLKGRDPREFALSTTGQGHLQRFAEFCERTDAATVARGALPHEHAAMRRHVAVIDRWLDQLVTRLEG